jgi:hypothetical protein
VVGYVALDNIIASKEYLLQNNLFIALIGEEIQQTLKSEMAEKKGLTLSIDA